MGASGQIGVELTLALRKIYGNANGGSDLREENELLKGSGPHKPGCDEQGNAACTGDTAEHHTDIFAGGHPFPPPAKKIPTLPGV